MATRAPSRWSTAMGRMLAAPVPGAPACTSFGSRAAMRMIGTGARNESTAAATSVWGAMTTMPSTAWAMKCSRTVCMVSAS
ncbi:hypothetical protein D3C74_344360 [compost metagenome]